MLASLLIIVVASSIIERENMLAMKLASRLVLIASSDRWQRGSAVRSVFVCSPLISNAQVCVFKYENAPADSAISAGGAFCVLS